MDIAYGQAFQTGTSSQGRMSYYNGSERFLVVRPRQKERHDVGRSFAFRRYLNKDVVARVPRGLDSFARYDPIAIVGCDS